MDAIPTNIFQKNQTNSQIDTNPSSLSVMTRGIHRTRDGNGSDASANITTPGTSVLRHRKSGSLVVSHNPNAYTISTMVPLRYDQLQHGKKLDDDSITFNDTNMPPVARVYRNRIQRLRELVIELNTEIFEGREDGNRAAELKGQIAELTRENEGGNASEAISRGSIPPPYEPRSVGI